MCESKKQNVRLMSNAYRKLYLLGYHKIFKMTPSIILVRPYCHPKIVIQNTKNSFKQKNTAMLKLNHKIINGSLKQTKLILKLFGKHNEQ